jgi:C-terminal processing protease CtpA/Prc
MFYDASPSCHLANMKLLLTLLLTIPLMATAGSDKETNRAINAAFNAKDFARAEQLLDQAFTQDKDAEPAFEAGAAFARFKQPVQAMRYLTLADARGYAQFEDDNDFAILESVAAWAPLRARLLDRAEKEARLWKSKAFTTPFKEHLTDEEKVAGLSRYWSEVKYNFVYTDTLKELDWDKVYLDYLPKVRATKTTYEYYRVLMSMNALLKDGHTNVYLPGVLYDRELARPPVRARLVEGRVFIIDSFDPALRANGVVPGVEVKAIDGVPVKEWAQRETAPYMASSTPQDLDLRTYGYSFLAGPIAHQPKVRFEGADGKAFDVAVPRLTGAALGKVRPSVQPFELTMLPNGVAHIKLNDFGSNKAANEFIARFAEVSSAKALVLDIRNNGGGDSGVGYRILSTLVDKPFKGSAWATRKYLPSYRAWGRDMPLHAEDAFDNQPHKQLRYTGPVIMLTGPATFSAAEDFAVAFDTAKRGAIIGEATGGSTGQPLFFDLPGGGSARVCTKRDTYADGKAFVGVGVQPHVKAAPTVADLRAGRDTVLEAALAHLRKGP